VRKGREKREEKEKERGRELGEIYIYRTKRKQDFRNRIIHFVMNVRIRALYDLLIKHILVNE
jgi:hypothetical protein